MQLVRLVGIGASMGVIGQLALVIWSMCTGGSVLTALLTMAQVPWGLTTLADLYLGLLLVALWIPLVENSARRAIPWWIGLFLLGNLATMAFVAWRCFTQTTLRAALLGERISPR